jgi:hypothetical protein
LSADECWRVPGVGVVLIGGGTLPTRACEGPPGDVLAVSVREGRVARGGAVITVGVDVSGVESRLVGGGLKCPGCGGVLRPWGWAGPRTLREGEAGLTVRLRRSRCGSCRGSHVLLPVFALLRRADVVTVVGAALAVRAGGASARAIAAGVGRPVETVRGWLRRFADRAEAMRVWFTRLSVQVGVDPIPPEATGSAFADAVAAVAGACRAVASRWPEVATVPPWWVAAGVSNGRLLAAGWP